MAVFQVHNGVKVHVRVPQLNIQMAPKRIYELWVSLMATESRYLLVLIKAHVRFPSLAHCNVPRRDISKRRIGKPRIGSIICHFPF